MMHNYLRREMIVKARSATSVEYLVICSGTANSRTGDQRVPCHPDSLLTKELRLTWLIRTEDKPKHPSRKTLMHSCCRILRKKKTVSLVRVHDEGGMSQTALVEIAGAPAYGIVDIGADITVMGPKLFKKVAMFAKLKKRQF